MAQASDLAGVTAQRVPCPSRTLRRAESEMPRQVGLITPPQQIKIARAASPPTPSARQLNQNVRHSKRAPARDWQRTGSKLHRGVPQRAHMRQRSRSPASSARRRRFEIRIALMLPRLVYGRKTYQLMVPYWPDVAKDPSSTKADKEFAQAFVSKKKVVFSRSLAQR